MQQKRFVKVAEVADVLSVAPATIRAWTKQGKIPALRVGSQTSRYNLAQVIEALQQPVNQTTGTDK